MQNKIEFIKQKNSIKEKVENVALEFVSLNFS